MLYKTHIPGNNSACQRFVHDNDIDEYLYAETKRLDSRRANPFRSGIWKGRGMMYIDAAPENPSTKPSCLKSSLNYNIVVVLNRNRGTTMNTATLPSAASSISDVEREAGVPKETLRV